LTLQSTLTPDVIGPLLRSNNICHKHGHYIMRRNVGAAAQLDAAEGRKT